MSMLAPAAVVALLASLLPGPPSLLSAVVGGAAGFGLFFLIAIIGRGKMGAGDVKLAGVIGLMIGFPAAITALVIGIFLGGAADHPADHPSGRTQEHLRLRPLSGARRAGDAAREIGPSSPNSSGSIEDLRDAVSEVFLCSADILQSLSPAAALQSGRHQPAQWLGWIESARSI